MIEAFRERNRSTRKFSYRFCYTVYIPFSSHSLNRSLTKAMTSEAEPAGEAAKPSTPRLLNISKSLIAGGVAGGV